MGSLNPENGPKQEFDDSGYVQEDGATKECPSADMSKNQPDLLDLSDDVLLYILQYCSPIDLKALGFTCPRLGTLVLDRTLWRRVDARRTPADTHRMRWLLTHALSAHTHTLRLSGFAREARGCLGYVNRSNEDLAAVTTQFQPIPGEGHKLSVWNSDNLDSYVDRSRLLRLCAEALPRYAGEFPEECPEYTEDNSSGTDVQAGLNCPGPQATLSHASLCRLTALCSNLTELALQHVVIDCGVTKICMFPQSLRVLSLLGTKCFHAEKSLLYKVQDHLVNLEELDVSECEWVEPACMLPLSKLPRLARLTMRLCSKLTEFVAYASLATRYGFKQLRVVDLRGSPVGDSEVSALGWVARLEELYLSPAPPAPRVPTHVHFTRHEPPPRAPLHAWEHREPEYYKCKYETEEWIAEENSQPNRDWKQDAMRSCVLLHHLSLMGAGPEDDQRATSSAAANASTMQQRIIIPRNGVRRHNPTDTNDSSGESTSTNQESGTPCREPRKRKTADDDDNTKKHFKDNNRVKNEASCSNVLFATKQASDEPCCSKTVRIANEPMSNESTSVEPMSSELTSNEPMSDELTSSEPMSSELTSDEPMSNEPTSSSECNPINKTKDIQTKGSRKHFDPSYRVARTTLKYCLDDFKKRTQSSDMSDDSLDSYDELDDDDDSDRPQSKRCRVDAKQSDAGSSKKSKRSSDFKHKENNESNQEASSSRDGSDSNIKETNLTTYGKLFNQYRYDQYEFLSNQSRDGAQNQEQPRYVTFQRNRPPLFCGNNHSVGGNQSVVIGGCNPPVVIGDQPVMERRRDMPPVVVVSGGNQPSVMVRWGENQPAVVVRCDNQPPAVVVGCGNQPVLASENQPAIVVGCGHNQPSMHGGDNQPAIVVGCSHNQPVIGDNQPAVVVGCGHDDNHNIQNNNDVQQPDWNNRLNMQDLNLEGQRQEAAVNAAPTQANAAPTGENATRNAAPPENDDLSRHRILYINVGRRRHAMYQISMPEPIDMLSPPLTAAMNLIYSSQVAPRLEYTSLVTDAAIRRFGRADGENINYVQIGPLGPAPNHFVDTHARPSRSNLRILSVTGFRHVTNYSLAHLATAAPNLQMVDFTGTRVTDLGVRHFRNFRPDCRVRYGTFDMPKEDCERPHSR